MPKYRTLTKDELTAFEKEFVDYLVVNGITADEWERLKKSENEKAEQILALFSDVIFEAVLRKIKFLDVQTKGYIQAIQCTGKKMTMVALTTMDDEIDLRNIKGDLKPLLLTGKIQLHQGEKNYTDEREQELFEMTERGCQMADGTLFKQLILLTA